MHLLQRKMCQRGKEYPAETLGRNGRRGKAVLASAVAGHRCSLVGRGWDFGCFQGSTIRWDILAGLEPRLGSRSRQGSAVD